jgi:aldose 1-epimerase
VRLASEVVEVEVLPAVGARLHRLRAFGQDLLRTPDDPGMHARDPFFWGSYVLAPWANRLAAVPTRVAGGVVDLSPNFPDGSAIHGQVHACPWEVADPVGVFRVRHDGGGWPWRYGVEQRLEVAGPELGIVLRLTNQADGPMPAGLGLHPWFRRPLQVAIRAKSVYPTNARPPARPEPVTGALDRRTLGPLAEGTDATWTDLHPDPLELAWPELGIRAVVRAGASATHVVAAAPLGLDATAVEVQTHAPDGLGRLLRGEPGALELLPPGATLELRATFSFDRA